MEEDNRKSRNRVVKKKTNRKKLITICVFIVLIISTFVIVFSHLKKEEKPMGDVKVNMGKHGEYSKYPKQIIGSWSTDGITIYNKEES